MSEKKMWMSKFLPSVPALTMALALGGCLGPEAQEGEQQQQEQQQPAANLVEYGSRTPFATELLARGIDSDVIYVNAAEVTEEDTQELRFAFASGSSVLLDGTTLQEPSAIEKLSASIGGLGIQGQAVLLRHGEQGIAYEQFQAVDAERVSTQQEAQALAAYAHQVLSAPELKTRVSKLTAGERYQPIYTYTVGSHRTNFSCWLHKGLNGLTWNGNTVDACNGQGSVNLIYTVDMIRSVPGAAGNVISEDAKYLRISINKNTGGAGWHLANNLTQEHTWFESWAHRDDWTGPFANKYSFSIDPQGDTGVEIYGHLPSQTNPQQTINTSSSVNVGISVGGNAEVNTEGPKVGGQIGAQGSITNSREISYTTNEYTVENHTGGRTARWVWDRKYDAYHCDWLSRRFGLECFFYGAYWDGYFVFRGDAFSPISYANFVPSFAAIYRAPPTRTGVTNFRLDSTVEVMALAGKVAPTAFMSAYAEVGRTWNTVTTSTQLSVDWGHPFFEPEANVRLQSLDANDECLDVLGFSQADGAPVVGYDCHGRNNQLWGLNAQEQYRSRVAPDRCLTVEPNLTLSVRSCTNGLNQKWYWNTAEQALMSRYADGTGTRYRLAFTGRLNTAKVAPVAGPGTHANNYLSNPQL
ncbi:leukocidin family pore-forming toxin [Hyalangium gracile]|uniref:leukocidin family pore-forming toxin n=1 Tax=Hyalangium gracile TaxID=394092 RepID=UPI001CCCFCFE|nr:leukocidin family pore-forming toxin [Hyalangium gracile]